MFDDKIIIALILSAVIGYGFGSIPFGLILPKLFRLGDIRKIGSGNIGATNVLRSGNKKVALMVLLLDGGKGAFAVWLTLALGLSSWGRDDPAMMAAIFAVLGHIFPIWLKFKGGKGVATTLGVLLMISWPVGLLCLGAWLVTALIWKYSSLAAMVSLALAPSFMWLITNGDNPASYLAAFFAFLTLVRHRENIHRLIAGTETKIKLGKAK